MEREGRAAETSDGRKIEGTKMRDSRAMEEKKQADDG